MAEEEEISCVLAEYGPTGVKVLNACKLSKTPLIVHFHGYDAYRAGVANDPSYTGLFEYAFGIIGVSEHMCAHLIANLNAPPEKVHYVPYSVINENLALCRPACNPPTLLAVGRFVEKKAPHLTLLAFAVASQSVPTAKLEMIGDGPLLGPCKALANALRICERVVFHGPKAHDWVLDRMQQVRAFVRIQLLLTTAIARALLSPCWRLNT